MEVQAGWDWGSRTTRFQGRNPMSSVFGVIFFIHCFVTNYVKNKKKVPAFNNKRLLPRFASEGQKSRNGSAGWFLARGLSWDCRQAVGQSSGCWQASGPLWLLVGDFSSSPPRPLSRLLSVFMAGQLPQSVWYWDRRQSHTAFDDPVSSLRSHSILLTTSSPHSVERDYARTFPPRRKGPWGSSLRLAVTGTVVLVLRVSCLLPGWGQGWL